MVLASHAVFKNEFYFSAGAENSVEIFNISKFASAKTPSIKTLRAHPYVRS
jgi:hypothetical protein